MCVKIALICDTSNKLYIIDIYVNFPPGNAIAEPRIANPLVDQPIIDPLPAFEETLVKESYDELKKASKSFNMLTSVK